jgi:hypothetical protein
VKLVLPLAALACSVSFLLTAWAGYGFSYL